MTVAALPRPAAQDFRVRVAAERRDRMRARLIAATMQAYVDSGNVRPPVIDDVIRLADVSRGTFYKYFDSLEEVLAGIGRRTAGEMLSSFQRLFDGVDDAAVRVAAGPLMAMARAAMEPCHAAFIARVDFIDFLGGADPRSQIVERCLADGRAQGRLKFESLDAAVDLVIGVSLEGARRVLKTRSLDGATIRETTTLVLIALGLARKAAERAVGQAWQHLQEHAAELHWWKPVTGL
jgi:AcrR family transcriptional regulator